MSSHLPEAAMMEEYCRERPGQVMAGLNFLDLDQSHRLVLENLIQGSNGCLFEEQENHAGGDSLPVHIRKERGFYLNKTKDFSGVQTLLEAMSRLYAVPGYTAIRGMSDARKWFLKRCETLDDSFLALNAMTEYFITLADGLPELDNDDGMTLRLRGEFWSSITYDGGGNDTGFIMQDVPVDEDDCGFGQPTRQVLVHNPNGDKEKDWIQRQPVKWQLLLADMLKCRRLKDLSFFNSVIREKTEKRVYKGSQLRVLWDTYFGKRDYLRNQVKQLAARNMGVTAARLVSSIDRQDNARKIGKVGACLYAWSKDEPFNGRKLPGEISQPEWAVIWDVYKTKKTELLDGVAQLQALKGEML